MNLKQYLANTPARRSILMFGALLFMASVARANVSFTAAGSNPVTGDGALRIGNDFAVSGDGITITSLGIFVVSGNGLNASHSVSLFVLTGDDTGSVAGSVVLPAGTGGVLDGAGGSANAFRFVALDTPIYLPAGTRGSVVAYSLYSGANFTTDTFGDGAGLPTGNVAWFGHDRYNFDENTTGLPTYAGSDNNLHAAASFLYVDGSVPEPASLTLLLAASSALLLRRKSHRGA